MDARPGASGTVAGPDIDIELRFNSRIDAVRSKLILVLPDQSVRPIEAHQSSTPASLAAHVKGLGSGEYKLRWQVLAADGHITRGEFGFQVR